jgi:hypothetical protein
MTTFGVSTAMLFAVTQRLTQTRLGKSGSSKSANRTTSRKIRQLQIINDELNRKAAEAMDNTNSESAHLRAENSTDGRRPTQPGLLSDLDRPNYFEGERAA